MCIFYKRIIRFLMIFILLSFFPSCYTRLASLPAGPSTHTTTQPNTSLVGISNYVPFSFFSCVSLLLVSSLFFFFYYLFFLLSKDGVLSRRVHFFCYYISFFFFLSFILRFSILIFYAFLFTFLSSSSMLKFYDGRFLLVFFLTLLFFTTHTRIRIRYPLLRLIPSSASSPPRALFPTTRSTPNTAHLQPMYSLTLLFLLLFSFFFSFFFFFCKIL
ncbi:hypothetical protein DFH27DRAFT_25241 [Peziza echinospora]|nr:hypothetical protein DFH27DRAFT_25241 [Peziza echinospora]